MRNELKTAQKRFYDAEEYLDLAIDLRRHCALRNNDCEERLRRASRTYLMAARHLRTSLDRLNRFKLRGINPDGMNVMPKQSRRADGMSAGRDRKYA